MGSDDEIGAANYLTNATTLEAASLIQTGQTYQLGIEITEETLGLVDVKLLIRFSPYRRTRLSCL